MRSGKPSADADRHAYSQPPRHSQLQFLDALTRMADIEWGRVEAFHLDEYVGLRVTHPGSFRGMFMEQLVPTTGISRHHLLDRDARDPGEVVRRAGESSHPRQLISPSSESGRTVTSLSTILPRTSRQKTLISLRILMRIALGSRSERLGSPIHRRYPGRRFRCPYNRFSKRRRTSSWFQISAKLGP